MARKLIVEIIGDTSSLEKSFRKTSHGAQVFERDISKTTRGVIAGSGAFEGLGRSVAFASSYFIGGVGITALLTKSVEAATDSAAAQRQLSAQFKAGGQDLARYRDRIEESTLAVSRLSGFNETELTQSFTTAFRGSQKVGVALQIQATAADVARGRHIELSAATIALTKAYSGQATALKRLGIIVPAHLKGMAALEFVQQRFKGQAEAGTTAQERFSAALHNTEVTIGTAFLPILNRYLNKLTKWLDDSKNQKKIQHDTNKALNTTQNILGGLGDLWNAAAKGVDKYNEAVKKIPGHDKSLLDIFRSLPPFLRHGLLDAGRHPGPTPLGAGQSPIGENALGGGGVAAAAAAATAAGGASGLHAQLVRSRLALARAEVTATEADDRRVLADQARIIRAGLAQTTNLKKRTSLYQLLGSIENQIRSIDDKRASAEQEARQKQLDAERERQRKFADLVKKANQQVQDYARRTRDALRKQREALASAEAAVRSEIGGIFTGPVFNAPAGVLGISNARAVGGTVGAGGFVSNLRQQTAQLVAFNNNLARLARRGAPGGLISQLRQGGLEQGPLIHQLATAGRPTLRSLFRAFAQQEKVVQQIAHADVQAKTVTIVTSNLRGSATAPSSQRRGRQAGIPNTLAQNLGF